MASPARTITVAFDMSNAFDTINIHTLIRKLLQSNIPGTLIKFIAHYINGRKAHTTYRNYTSSQRNSKLAFYKVASFHQHSHCRHTTTLSTGSDHDSTIKSTHTSSSAAKKYKFCLDKTKQSHTKSRQNNLHSVYSRSCII